MDQILITTVSRNNIKIYDFIDLKCHDSNINVVLFSWSTEVINGAIKLYSVCLC